MSNPSKLFKKRQVILNHQSFVVAIPEMESAPVQKGEGSDEASEGDPVELALQERHHLLSEADLEAREIVAAAKKTSEEIILSAYDKAAEIRRAAYDDGYGAGMREAESEYERKWDDAKKELSEIKKELLAAREELFVNSEREMVELVLNIVEKLISNRKKEDEELAATLVHRSISGLTHINHIVVRISKADAGQAESIKNRLMLGRERIDSVKIKIDDSLDAGCCVVETDRGMIDAGLDLQLNKVRRAFRSLIEDRDA